jgi:hypothetical protein
MGGGQMAHFIACQCLILRDSKNANEASYVQHSCQKTTLEKSDQQAFSNEKQTFETFATLSDLYNENL